MHTYVYGKVNHLAWNKILLYQILELYLFIFCNFIFYNCFSFFFSLEDYIVCGELIMMQSLNACHQLYQFFKVRRCISTEFLIQKRYEYVFCLL